MSPVKVINSWGVWEGAASPPNGVRGEAFEIFYFWLIFEPFRSHLGDNDPYSYVKERDVYAKNINKRI